MRDDEYRVYLRPITGDDAEDVVRWRNSASVKKFFIYQGTFTKEGQLEWIEKKVKSGEVIQFIIVERKSEKSIGCVFIKDLDQIHKKGEFGIFIGEEDARGKGYGREAAKQILSYAFSITKLHRVYLRVLADNQRAISSYEDVGFKHEGILKDDVFINGVYKDIVWMAQTNPNDKN